MNNKYGQLPKNLGLIDVDIQEMVFYQYMPIKVTGSAICVYEDRLQVLKPIIEQINNDFVKDFGSVKFLCSNIYLTVKKLYQTKGYSFNREGYHSDGFMTNDINYIWCDKSPTVFNYSDFNLTLDDKVSMQEMELQAKKENIKTYPENSLLRLDQFNIHKVNDNKELVLRTFIKVSFSCDKYDLKGNTKNYLLDYDWEMREREQDRNIPQNIELMS